MVGVFFLESAVFYLSIYHFPQRNLLEIHDKPRPPTLKMPKGRGKRSGKGGNRTFAMNADDIKKADDRAKARAMARAERRKDCDDSDSESDSGSDGEDASERASAFEQMKVMAEKEKEKEYKPKGSESVIEVQNLNRGARRNVKMKDLDKLGAAEKGPMSRKERERAEAERKKRAYMERHKRGETEEARKDLERLKLIRARREREAQRKKEEEEAAKSKKKTKKVESSEEEEDYEDLTSREIKKMNPGKLKEELSKRGQNTQGNKKALQKRLLDWCKENQKS